MSETSQARQHWGRTRSRGSQSGSHAPHGIDIPAKPETAHLGDSLSRGELDWVEWRVNRFLAQPTAAEASRAGNVGAFAVAAIEGLPHEAAAVPQGTKIRIETDSSETRVHFPSGFDMHSLNGLGSMIFGAGWSGYFCFALSQAWERPGGPAKMIGCVVLIVAGLLFLLTGVGRLFGRSRLTISPKKIIFQTTVLGIGPWTTLSTAEVLSVGSSTKPRTRSGRVLGPAKGHVIRTGTGEIRYGTQLRTAARNKAEAEWAAGEIALRIHAARSGSAATTRHAPTLVAGSSSEPASDPSPPTPVPYAIDRRPAPAGDDIDALLPARVGPFRRDLLDLPDDTPDASIYATYRSPEGDVSIEFNICANAEDAQQVIATAQVEVSGFEEHPDDEVSLNTEPSFFKTTSCRGVFMAWTRGNYYFSASTEDQNREGVFDRFLRAFPY